jgi:hypothetical protein
MFLVVLSAWIQRNCEVDGHALAGILAHREGEAQLVNICAAVRRVTTRAKTEAAKA